MQQLCHLKKFCDIIEDIVKPDKHISIVVNDVNISTYILYHLLQVVYYQWVTIKFYPIIIRALKSL